MPKDRGTVCRRLKAEVSKQNSYKVHSSDLQAEENNTKPVIADAVAGFIN
jgi:hypothetical protein